MHGMLFGMETELAFAASGREDGAPAATRARLAELFALARERLVALPDGLGTGLFLANGARFYLDQGDHPEICTPECRSPVEVVRWQLACERILAELVAEIEKRRPRVRVSLFRCNVDYGGSGASWGCHESYQHRRTHEEMAPQLVPHLVSRLVYTGAGGFDNRQGRLEFLLSPRVPQLVREIGADTLERGIYNLRDEPLAGGGFRRLHVICGESLCSELSNYLKIGTTALVVRLIDAGVCSGRRLRLENAVGAMRRIARDPTLRAAVELDDGRRLTGLEIQAEYLGMVEAQLGADFMPAWAPELCLRWRQVLEQLERRPESLGTSLDWAIKHALFEDRIGRAGLRGAELSRANGLGAVLCELDTRFGELSPHAIFHALDEAGTLTHRIPERGAIEDAMEEPPSGTRAEARGRAIRELHARSRADGEWHSRGRAVGEWHSDHSRYLCDWDGIRDLQEGRHLDLGDPFATTGEWKSQACATVARGTSPIERQIDRGHAAYGAHDLPRAVSLLEQAVRAASEFGDGDRAARARFWCSSAHHDAGRLDAAEAVLAPALEELDDCSPPTRIRVWTRYALLQLDRPAPLDEIHGALEGARAAFELAGGDLGKSRIALIEARLLGARGSTAEAARRAEEALTLASADPIAFCISSHVRWLQKFLLRAGWLRRALSRLETAREQVRASASPDSLRVVLDVAGSNLALRIGRQPEACVRACDALAHSTRFRQHRARLAACIAYLEAVAGTGRLENAQPIVDEVRAWRGTEIGELRLESQRALALVHRSRTGSAAELEDAPDRLQEARAAARVEAARLDARLACDHHQRELDERLA